MLKLEVNVPEQDAARLKETILNASPNARVVAGSPSFTPSRNDDLQEDELTEYGVLND
jgi:hypothetical protein